MVDSLVLYKGQPGIVRRIGDKKLAIDLADGEQVSVRPKDITVIHPGPSPHPSRLETIIGDPRTAWELLNGSQTTLRELAELAYGDYSPSAAWAVCRLLSDGLYFGGTADRIVVHSRDQVEAIRLSRELKAAEERDWESFISRAAAGRIALDDERYLADVIALALGRSDSSRTLKRLNKPQTSESAHAFLLAAGRWRPVDNPYPARFGIKTEQPELPVGPMLDDHRRDLTGLLSLAIDDEGNTDPDDAISLDGDTLWVHIADVAAMITTDHPADIEARSRGANLYLPEGTIHMLPQQVTHLLALGLHAESPALSIAIGLLPSAEVVLKEITPSRIRVQRVSYEAAERSLARSPYRELLAIAERNRSRRIEAGAVEIDLPEVQIRTAIDGQVVIRPLPPLNSRQMVREAMLMAGEAIGRYAVENDIPLGFAVQDPPTDIALTPKAEVNSLSRMWTQRRAMQRSRVLTVPGRHSGLGLDAYVQVTSPLRRYLDLLAHQQLRLHLQGRPPIEHADVVQRAGEYQAVAGVVRSVERFSNQHMTLVYLMQNAGWEGNGIVVENKHGSDIVLIPELAWETEIYHQPLPLDSIVRLRVESVDLPNRSARFTEL